MVTPSTDPLGLASPADRTSGPSLATPQQPAGERAAGPPRVAIVFYDTYLGCAPSLINAARLLVEHGYLVDIFLRASRERFAAPPDLGAKVRIIRLGNEAAPPTIAEEASASARASQRFRWLKDRLSEGQRRRMATLVEALRRSADSLRPSRALEVFAFARQLRAAAKSVDYRCVIGVDTHGLVAAHRMVRGSSVPVIYWSLEIMFLRNFRLPMARYAKRLERRFHQRSLALVIQDQERADALRAENRAWQCPTLIVPNSPRGEVADDVRRDYFHARFRLSPETRVILHAGSVCEGMRSADLARAAADWPADDRLVFHSHTHLNPSGEYVQSLVRLGAGRVLLSTEPVDYDALDTLIASASIGLVIYDNTLGPNFQLLAGASGKLAHYLRCGIPVISIENASIGRVLDEFGCGIGVDSVEDVASAVQKIFSDYAGFSRRALACYLEAYEFEKHFGSVLELLARLPASPAAASHREGRRDG